MNAYSYRVNELGTKVRSKQALSNLYNWRKNHATTDEGF